MVPRTVGIPAPCPREQVFPCLFDCCQCGSLFADAQLERAHISSLQCNLCLTGKGGGPESVFGGNLWFFVFRVFSRFYFYFRYFVFFQKDLEIIFSLELCWNETFEDKSEHKPSAGITASRIQMAEQLRYAPLVSGATYWLICKIAFLCDGQFPVVGILCACVHLLLPL